MVCISYFMTLPPPNSPSSDPFLNVPEYHIAEWLLHMLDKNVHRWRNFPYSPYWNLLDYGTDNSTCL